MLCVSEERIASCSKHWLLFISKIRVSQYSMEDLGDHERKGLCGTNMGFVELLLVKTIALTNLYKIRVNVTSKLKLGAWLWCLASLLDKNHWRSWALAAK